MIDTGTLVSLQGRCIQWASTVCTLHTVNSCLAGSAEVLSVWGWQCYLHKCSLCPSMHSIMCALDLWIAHSIWMNPYKVEKAKLTFVGLLLYV